MTKITVEITDEHGILEQEVSLIGTNDLTGNDIVNMFGKVMLALGYQPQTVKEVLNTDEYNSED